ncbi:retrovirus-related pol polyprotein from transposon TNT 1-94 [Tanacetum coccineum]
MTRSSNTKVFTPFTNPKRQFRSRKDITPIAVHKIYSFYESESSESESKDLNEIDIETLTLEQYLALNRNNSQVGVKRLGIEKNIVFEIKIQLLRELRENTFSGGKMEDAMEHIRKILEIASLFNTPGILGNDITLQIFPLTLIGTAKRWFGRASSDLLKTWDEFKQVFIRRFCPPSELVSNKIQIEELSMVKLNARCSAVLQNELPPKEKDQGSFVLPCIIGNTTVSNALADLGDSISVIPFSMFKRLGLGNPRPVNMVIEMADRSMQSPKGIVENVPVKIHKFMFPVDFVILDIVEDNKVPIILGRPMLATAHARIDVFGGKI